MGERNIFQRFGDWIADSGEGKPADSPDVPPAPDANVPPAAPLNVPMVGEFPVPPEAASVAAGATHERAKTKVRVGAATELAELRSSLNPIENALARFDHQVTLKGFRSDRFVFPDDIESGLSNNLVNIRDKVLAHFKAQKWSPEILNVFEIAEGGSLQEVMANIFAGHVVSEIKKEFVKMKPFVDEYKKKNPNVKIEYWIEGDAGLKFLPSEFVADYERHKADEKAKDEPGETGEMANLADDLEKKNPIGKLLKFLGYKRKPAPPAEPDPKAKYFEDLLGGGGILGGHLFGAVILEMFGYGGKYGIDVVKPALALVPGGNGEKFGKAFDKMAEKARKSRYGAEGESKRAASYKEVSFYDFNEIIKGGKGVEKGVQLAETFDAGSGELIVKINKGGKVVVPGGVTVYIGGERIAVPKDKPLERTDAVANSQVVFSGRIPKGTVFANTTFELKTPEA